MDYTELLPPLPPYLYGRECSENERVWSEEAVRAAQLAAIAATAPAIRKAERERVVALIDDYPYWLGAKGKDDIAAAIRALPEEPAEQGKKP